MRRFRETLSVAAAALLLSATAAQAAGELHLYNWSNYFPPDLIEKFQKEFDVTVTLDNYSSEDDLLAKLQAGGGGYDVVFPGPRILKAMIESDLAAKVMVNEMENFANVAGPFRTLSTDPNREYSAPYMWGTTGYTYDPAKVPGGELEESWAPLFEPPDELKGEIAMLDEMADVWNAAAYYLGIGKCTTDGAEAQKILDLLSAQKPHVKVYSNDGTIDRTIAGEVAVHMQWNGAAHRVKKEKPDFVYVYPKEGVTFWTDSMAVPANAPNLENAKTFLDWMMAPENAAAASNYTGYMNAISGSGEFLDPGLQQDPAVNMPEDFGERLSPYEECPPESLELRERVWTKLKS